VTIIEDTHVLFKTVDDTNCAAKTCELLDEKCAKTLVSDNVKMVEKTITANVDKKKGYIQAFCLKCVNTYKSAEIGFTLT
jgi:hypothetical protein